MSAKSRWVLPVGPLFSVGIIVGLGFGVQYVFGNWSLWKNDGKVIIALSLNISPGDMMSILGIGK